MQATPTPDEQTAIVEFLRMRGATRCPTAFVSPSTATLRPGEMVELRRHHAKTEAAAAAKRRQRGSAWRR
jgi:hypothetical protein